MRPAKSLRVQKGDKVSLEVMASYEINSGTATGLSANLTAMSLDVFQVNPALEVIKTNALEAFFDPKALLSDDENGIPHAYLNYILFDENYIPRASGAVRVSEAAENDLSGGQQNYNHEQLTFGAPVDIDYNGYLYIYVSNESNWEVKVYFDDLPTRTCLTVEQRIYTTA